MRRTFAVLLLMAVLVTGCARGGKAPAPPQPPATPPRVVNEAPVAAPVDGPDLFAAAGPFDLTLEELHAGLRRLANQEPDKAPGAKLDALFRGWKLPVVQGRVFWLDADLNGDGAVETVVALNSNKPEVSLAGRGAVFVIHRKGGSWEVDRTEGDRPGLYLHGAADLTGAGRTEIVASSTEAGAHTAYSTVHVLRWEPGRFTDMPSAITVPMMTLTISGRDLVLVGGLIGSAGAGGLQRERMERYRWREDRFVQEDRQFAPSAFAYHRLQDGITAEQFGRMADAIEAYTQAMEVGREAVPAGALTPETADRFPDAVRAFARMRLAALHLTAGRLEAGRTAAAGAEGRFAGLVESMAGATGGKTACLAAMQWGEKKGDEFFEVINSPLGYANPQWHYSQLCGPLPAVS